MDSHGLAEPPNTPLPKALFFFISPVLPLPCTPCTLDLTSTPLVRALRMQAAYSLYLRAVMTRMGPLTAKSGGVDELGMVVYNNLLSIPMIAALAVYTGEVARLPSEPALREGSFLAAATSSAIMSFLISLASMWFLSCTTATTFSLVGSLNKIPLAALGMLLFSAPTTVNNVLSILIGLIAGVVFAHAKSADARRAGAKSPGSLLAPSGRGTGSSGGGGGKGGHQLPVVHATAGVLQDRGAGGSLLERIGSGSSSLEARARDVAHMTPVITIGGRYSRQR